ARPLSRARAACGPALSRATGRATQRIPFARLEAAALGRNDVRLAPDSPGLRCAGLDATPDRPCRGGGQAWQRLRAGWRALLSRVADRRSTGARPRDFTSPRRRDSICLTRKGRNLARLLRSPRWSPISEIPCPSTPISPQLALMTWARVRPRERRQNPTRHSLTRRALRMPPPRPRRAS